MKHILKRSLNGAAFCAALSFALVGGMMGGVVIAEAVGAPVRAVVLTSNPNCNNIDACSESLTCKQVSGIWQAVSPSAKALYKKGLLTDVTCYRLTFATSACTNGTRSDYDSPTCGFAYP